MRLFDLWLWIVLDSRVIIFADMILVHIEAHKLLLSVLRPVNGLSLVYVLRPYE